MERLTHKGSVNALLKTDSDPQAFNSVCCGCRSIDRCVTGKRKECNLFLAIERLAAYEDTELTPEEILNQVNNMRIAYRIINGYEKCIRDIFRKLQHIDGKMYIDAEEARDIIDRVMSSRIKGDKE